ncbi:MAG: PAS domain S-box protein [Desulfovermiculus sp.]|nr:PAS domain S-box protein [Desulfovermiculus sp.]
MDEDSILRQNHAALEEKNRQLLERIKELNCLYELSSLFSDRSIPEPELLHRAADRIPSAWQYPDITCARLVWKGQEYATNDFQETRWEQSSDIRINRTKMGFVQVCYLEERPIMDEGPFLKEERSLLDTLATNLSHYLETRQIEREKRESEEFSRAIIQSSPLPIFSLDLDGNVLTWNAAAERVLGWEAAEVIGTPLPIVPDDKQGEFQGLMQRVALEGGFTGVEVVRQKKDGRRIDVNLSTAPLYDNQGQVYGIMAALEDITERKKVERAFVEATENLRITLNSIGDGVIATDIQGRITQMNPVAKKLTGWELEQAANRPLDQVFYIVNAQTGQRVENPVQKVLSSGRIVGLGNHTKLISRYGQEFQIADSGSPIRDNNGHILGVVLVFRDVSEESRVRKSLAESEQRFRSIVEGAPDPIFIQTEQKFAYINPAACRLFGITSAQEIIGAPVMDRFHPDFHQVIQERIRRLNEDRESVHELMEQKYLQMNGSEVWVEATGEPIVYEGKKGALVFVRNITRRKETEQALRESEARYRELFNSIRDAILVADTDRNIIDCNTAFTELFGYTLDEIKGHKTYTVYHDINEFEQMGQEITKNIDNPKFLFTVRYATKTGEIFPGETSIFYLKNTKNQVTGFIGLIRDVSERQQAEAERERLEMQLRQAQKMEAIGRLAGGVAHDFNNLLTTITGNAEIGLMDLDKDQDLYEIMQEIKGAGERAGNLTRQLLAFSRRQILQPEILDLNDLILDLEKMLRRLIGEDISLVTHLSSSLGLVEADQGQMEQVIMNLAVNARDAMPGGGKLTIETANVELDESYSRGHGHLVTPGPYVMLAVSDTGSGMSLEMQDQVFDPFFTTKEKNKGTGLGLSTVYGIVKQSKGNIWVYSEPGQGTTFKIYLPQAEKDHPSREPKPEIKPTLQGNERVLVVEDDPSVRKIAAKNLIRFGYTVFSAANGDEALAICREHKKEIDVLLTDVVMPGMSGKELVQKLQGQGMEISVVYMSGYTDNAIVHHGVLDPGLFFLQKPFSPESLASKVREALNQNQNID